MAWHVAGTDSLLIGKEPLMHLPKFSLFASAAGRLCRLESVLMNRFQGKVTDDILELPSANILLLDLWPRLTDVSPTEGSLEVSEFNQCQFGGLLPFKGRSIDSEHHVLRFGCRGSSRPSLQQSFDLLQIFLQPLLPCLERLDL